MKIHRTSELTREQKVEILNLWNAEYPTFLEHKSLGDFEGYLEKLGNASHLLAESGEEILGWMVSFDRAGETWFVLIVSSKIHGRGVGSKLMEVAKSNAEVLNGWVIEKETYKKTDGQFYTSPIGFYKKHGFEIGSERFENQDFEAVKVKWTAGS